MPRGVRKSHFNKPRVKKEHADKYRGETKYPEIYAHCYWGNFTSHKISPNNLIDEIGPNSFQESIKNRNRFVEEFGIKKGMACCRMPGRRYYDEAAHPQFLRQDHGEVYSNADGVYFCLMSPYDRSDQEDQLAAQEGYYAYPCMYAGAFTYIKALPKKKGGEVPAEIIQKLRAASIEAREQNDRFQ